MSLNIVVKLSSLALHCLQTTIYGKFLKILKMYKKKLKTIKSKKKGYGPHLNNY